MATPQTYQKTVLPIRVAKSSRNNIGLSKLFEAAVINRQFRQLLLNHPEIALQQGYMGNTFELTSEEQALIVSIRANSLTDLAQQVNKVLG